MEFFPVVEVIQVYGVFAGTGIILQAVGAEDGFAGAIVVIVAANRRVEFFDGCLIHLRTVLFDPGFKLAIGRLILFDEIDDCITI